MVNNGKVHISFSFAALHFSLYNEEISETRMTDEKSINYLANMIRRRRIFSGKFWMCVHLKIVKWCRNNNNKKSDELIDNKGFINKLILSRLNCC